MAHPSRVLVVREFQRMIFKESALQGAYVIELERRADDRGSFARVWCRREMEAAGLNANVVQVNASQNRAAGTLRGMHYQRSPFAETKLVRCVRGAIYDAIIDLRPESPTYKRWIGVELTPENGLMLYVPEGFAHGFQTLQDDTEVTYQVTQYYEPGAEGGLRYDDPAFRIEWPLPVTSISEKDRNWPDFRG